MIQANSFVKVLGDKLKDNDNLKAGDFLFVAGLKALPIDKKDPYTQRVHLLCHKSLGKGKVDTSEILLVDPSDCKELSPGKQRTKMRQFEEAYSNEGTGKQNTLN